MACAANMCEESWRQRAYLSQRHTHLTENFSLDFIDFSLHGFSMMERLISGWPSRLTRGHLIIRDSPKPEAVSHAITKDRKFVLSWRIAKSWLQWARR